ncbi:Protein of unknown function [Propionibacterium freudenreichii]|uniref:Uncharacterized protein n=1 Tax=Propionibacterium freudenreichii subsp. freudenreichii TaxID=66712 RepID=A0A0B7NY35_PROFF|nr:Protein of unknown function [Propionibacterium freudenreichii]CEP25994.1 Protein of unknown function [Propionibacterium freudenreichii subsp. freudenreichii]CEG92441.1 Protein of unknown function [Propionibacterium freudenreichii]CEG96253.1 Protein of unknown function [Propionibacterium freudenreichii]CEH01355.1 Protein of unknown function [Propionibacterium freudenreichii]
MSNVNNDRGEGHG